jgi:peptidoglycan/xylan/chitin deacetylase (PgdA/CDA1 family)
MPASRPLTPVERLPYRAAIDRQPVALPDGKSLAVWPVVNVENWLIENPMPRQVLVAPTGLPLLPDVANWAWHEYGMRAGFWRLLDAFARRGIRPTLSINGSVCTAYPRVAAAARDAGWEFMGHGFVQVPMHKVDDQGGAITRALDTIRSFTGEDCVGWLGPGLTETLETPDLLAAAGVRYIADFVVDDLPSPVRTQSGTVWSMPYSVELNDIPVFMIQHHSAEEFIRRTRMTADRLIAETAADGAKVMNFAVHPYITGVPHRIHVLEAVLDDLARRPEVVFMQGRAILDWYLEATHDA